MGFVYGIAAIFAAIGSIWTVAIGTSPLVIDNSHVLALDDATDITISVLEGESRESITARVGMALGYNKEKQKQFHDTYRIMQWDAFNELVVPHIVETHGLSEGDREILLTHNTAYLDTEEDILEQLFVPGPYTLSRTDTVAQTAEKLIAPVTATNTKEFVVAHLEGDAVADLLVYLEESKELLPDLVPLPPQDITLREEDGKMLLAFTTVYYNQGLGNLELRADPSTLDVPGDIVRLVNQRVYLSDGTYEDRSSGSFQWHQEHVHYHFVDFVEYKLAAVNNDEVVRNGGLAEKSTFCIRDVSRVKLNGTYTDNDAAYVVCGRERQGISVGWGDAYFQTYADQNFDVTELPSGEYELSFYVNPEDRFEELTKENNFSSARIMYDKEARKVTLLSTTPEELPDFEHIHVEKTY